MIKTNYIALLIKWVDEYIPVIFMSLGVISIALFGNLILEATKVGGNQNLYIPAWATLGLGLLFAALAIFTQHREDKKREQRERKREQREIKRDKRQALRDQITLNYTTGGMAPDLEDELKKQEDDDATS
jgi:hypothetical protein